MIEQLVSDYLIELKMKGSSTHTLTNYGYHLQKFVDYIKANELDYAKITARQIKSFRNQLVEAGLKPKSINTVIGALKSFFDYLLEEGDIKGNPIVTKRLRVKEGKALPKFLTPEELATVQKWLEGIPYHVSLGFRTMLATGLRVSEIAAVLPADLIKLTGGGYALRVRHGKGDKERYAPVMNAEVARDLVNYAEQHSGEGTLFKVTHHTFKGWARKCRIATGVQFHSHRCRHTVGTKLLQQGIPIDKVQDVLGHADISTTRRYAKTAPEAVLELAAKVEEVKEELAVYRYYLG